VRDVAADLLDPEMVKHTWLGLDVAATPEGLRVEQVAEMGPARDRIRQGDLITAVGPRRVQSRLAFNIELLEYDAGAEVPLVVRRDREVAVPVPLVEVPPGEAPVTGRKFDGVGLVVADITPPLAQGFGIDPKIQGVVITKVVAGSIADRMELAAGDVLYQLGDYAVRDTGTLSNLLRAYARRYRAVAIKVWRGGKKLSGSMPLG
jgi:serine protease Do